MAAAGVQDLGEWIGAGSHSLFNFPPGVRPVPLEIHIQGFDIVNFDSRLQAMARPTYASLVAAGNEARPLLLSAHPSSRTCAGCCRAPSKISNASSFPEIICWQNQAGVLQQAFSIMQLSMRTEIIVLRKCSALERSVCRRPR